MMLNSEILKSLIFGAGLHISMHLSLGRRHNERLAVVLFLVSSFYWVNLGSIQQLSELLGKRLADLLR